jgi:ParB/RepB/Spo0J family partition protein
MELSDRFNFKCTNCGKKIPWPLSKSDIGIADWKEPIHGDLYPFEKCWCGWGKFVRCEDLQDVSEPEMKAGIEAKIKQKVEAARYEKLAVKEIHPNPKQPRKFFDKVALQSLADSMATVGLLEDILVRPDMKNGGYEIVLGERRWRAAQIAQIETISTKIADLNDTEAKLISIIENVQRENLTEVEEAFTFKNYIDSGMSVEEVGKSLGKLDERVADKLKTLSGHYYIQFQENRIKELTKDLENLKEELRAKQKTNSRYKTQIFTAKQELTDAMNDGWEFVAQLSGEEFLLRKRVAL